MKKGHHFVRMRSGDHLGDSKTSKKAPRFVDFKFLMLTNRHRKRTVFAE